ncbi:regulator of G protein signaling domain-containing protein [Phthorimaea operculella]|nr:regulator of G protein signaling domain-containing protein [Phthorimaea operculella]
MVAIWYVHIDSIGAPHFEENRESDQSSPFRRWTTGSGAGSSYRHADHRNLFQKQMSEGSGGEANSSAAGGGARGARGAQWAHGGVARWSLGLDHLLADPVGRAAFADFLAREFAHENIIFWCSCEEYSQQQEAGARAQLAKRIWERHLADTAPEPVNVDASARRNTLARLHEQPPPIDLFHQAQRQIFHVMRMDSYQRFLRSGEHAECARADLRGLPPPQPYAHAANTKTHSRSATTTPPPDHSASSSISNVTGSAPNTPSKLKKSASNASDRRRSGGASLLPWRLRVPSRERAAAAVPPAAGPGLVPVPPPGVPPEGVLGQHILLGRADGSDSGGRTPSYHRDGAGHQASDIVLCSDYLSRKKNGSFTHYVTANESLFLFTRLPHKEGYTTCYKTTNKAERVCKESINKELEP